MLVALKTRKICVGVANDGEIVFGVKNKATSSCVFEIVSDALEGSFMGMLQFKSVSCTLVVYFKCTGRPAVLHEIQQHTHHCCIIECTNSRFATRIAR